MFRECPGRERPTYINLSSSESKWDFLKGVTAYANWGKKILIANLLVRF